MIFRRALAGLLSLALALSPAAANYLGGNPPRDAQGNTIFLDSQALPDGSHAPTVSQLDGYTPACTFSASSAAVVGAATCTGVTGVTAGAIDTTGYRSIMWQVTGNASANTVTFEVSNDGTTFLPQACTITQNVGGNAPATTTSSGSEIRICPLTAKWARARVSTFIGGTTTLVPVLRTVDLPSYSAFVSNTVSTSFFASSSAPGTTTSRVKSAATTNATSLKASAGNVFTVVLSNTSASVKFVKFYDKASAPTVGTDTPIFTVLLPAGQTITVGPAFPTRFTLGIAYAITGAVADTDTTATAVDDVHGVINWM